MQWFKINGFCSFFKKFDLILDGKMSVTLILDDPAGNSYIQTFNDDGTPDEGLSLLIVITMNCSIEIIKINIFRSQNHKIR